MEKMEAIFFKRSDIVKVLSWAPQLLDPALCRLYETTYHRIRNLNHCSARCRTKGEEGSSTPLRSVWFISFEFLFNSLN